MLSASRRDARRRQIACLSAAPWNPYLDLLYGHLAEHGYRVVHDPPFATGWLWRRRAQIGILHVHWPEGLYRCERGPGRLRPLLSRLKTGRFAWRLAVARALGYRLVWTIHQPLPHRSLVPALERSACRLLARSCDLLLAHDAWTADRAAAELGMPRSSIAIVPHGSYVGVYPPGRGREEVRRELGLPQDAFVFLGFGELRENRQTGLLLEAFAAAALPEARLVVAGNAKAPGSAEQLRAAAARDARVTALPGFVPVEGVAELFGAADAAVLPRGDGGTSGSLLLALSLGLPVVAADTPTARLLTREGEAGWLFRPGDRAALRSALEQAASDRDAAAARGRTSLAIAEELDWSEIAREVAGLLAGLPVGR